MIQETEPQAEYFNSGTLAPIPPPSPLIDQVLNINYDNTHDAEGKIKHKYWKTIFNFVSPPYCKMPVVMEGFDKATKKFTLIVLTDKRRMEHVPVGYPLIPITEQEAQDLVNHKLSTKQKENQTKPTMSLSNINVAEPEVKHNHKPEVEVVPVTDQQVGAPASVVEATAPAEPAKEKKPHGRAVGDGRPSIRSLAIAGLTEGKSKTDLVPLIKAVYPERDEKNIKSLISLASSGLKKKAKAATAVQVADAGTPAQEAAPESAEADPTEGAEAAE